MAIFGLSKKQAQSTLLSDVSRAQHLGELLPYVTALYEKDITKLKNYLLNDIKSSLNQTKLFYRSKSLTDLMPDSLIHKTSSYLSVKDQNVLYIVSKVMNKILLFNTKRLSKIFLDYFEVFVF